MDVEAKTNLESPFGTKEINFRCPKVYRPSVKKDKEHDTNQEYWDREKDKTKSHNPSFANS